MSWQATNFVANLPHSRVGHIPFRVLMLLADHAHDDGTATWRSVPSLASTLQVSERSILRALAELKAENLIRPGDQRLLAHLPSGKRPPVYDLNLNAQNELLTGVTNLSPHAENDGVTNLSGVTSGVGSLEEEPPLTTNKDLRRDHTADVTPTVCRGSKARIHVFTDSGWCLHCPTHSDGRIA